MLRFAIQYEFYMSAFWLDWLILNIITKDVIYLIHIYTIIL